MTAKILVADDSVTIQKVVKITLANDPYELEECTSEEDLFVKIKENSYDLILLDFNLSTKRNGYELTQAIKELSPKPLIMALLGTFDEVDESKIKEVGIIDKIVKPFESSKFIKMCRNLLKDIQDSDDSVNEEDEDNWVLDNPNEIKGNAPISDELPDKIIESPNALSEEVSGWGMELPDVIEERKGGTLELPPIIETSKKESDEIIFSTEDSDDDEFDESLLEDGSALMENIDNVNNEFTQEDDEFAEEDDEFASFENNGVNYPDEDDLDFPDPNAISIEGDEEETDSYSAKDDRDMEQLIDEELEPDEFWAVDDGVNTEIASNFKEPEPVQKSEPLPKEEQSTSHLGLENMEDELKEAMTPIIEELIKKYCEKTIQKIAWEVIPDLAENLIKKELREISKSIE